MIDPLTIKKCQEGDKASLEYVYSSLFKKAKWTAYLITGNLDTAEDVVQEVFYECFKGIRGLSKPELFHAWFNKILVRKCWNTLGSMKKNNSTSIEDHINELSTGTSDIFEGVQAQYEKALVRSSIKLLDTQMRTTIILYYYNELSIKEIADVMGCFQGTVKSRLHYAREKLRKELEMEFNENINIDSQYGKGGLNI